MALPEYCLVCLIYIALHPWNSHLRLFELEFHVLTKVFRFLLQFALHSVFSLLNQALGCHVYLVLKQVFSQSKVYQFHSVWLKFLWQRLLRLGRWTLSRFLSMEDLIEFGDKVSIVNPIDYCVFLACLFQNWSFLRL